MGELPEDPAHGSFVQAPEARATASGSVFDIFGAVGAGAFGKLKDVEHLLQQLNLRQDDHEDLSLAAAERCSRRRTQRLRRHGRGLQAENSLLAPTRSRQGGGALATVPEGSGGRPDGDEEEEEGAAAAAGEAEVHSALARAEETRKSRLQRRLEGRLRRRVDLLTRERRWSGASASSSSTSWWSLLGAGSPEHSERGAEEAMEDEKGEENSRWRLAAASTDSPSATSCGASASSSSSSSSWWSPLLGDGEDTEDEREERGGLGVASARVEAGTEARAEEALETNSHLSIFGALQALSSFAAGTGAGSEDGSNDEAPVELHNIWGEEDSEEHAQRRWAALQAASASASSPVRQRRKRRRAAAANENAEMSMPGQTERQGRQALDVLGEGLQGLQGLVVPSFLGHPRQSDSGSSGGGAGSTSAEVGDVGAEAAPPSIPSRLQRRLVAHRQRVAARVEAQAATAVAAPAIAPGLALAFGLGPLGTLLGLGGAASEEEEQEGEDHEDEEEFNIWGEGDTEEGRLERMRTFDEARAPEEGPFFSPDGRSIRRRRRARRVEASTLSPEAKGSPHRSCLALAPQEGHSPGPTSELSLPGAAEARSQGQSEAMKQGSPD
mmetsp:Transcript_97074/g.217203  ORF Transcript_97074/g.217203 Transcript_97074/m.217203 type:complete len:612 (+) Transcript_97074:30-1865(+)